MKSRKLIGMANKLHREIMNTRCPSKFYPNPSKEDEAYKIGHRDACHAAAELVLKTNSEMAKNYTN